ncbi:MAG: FG-GAP-like repeat-containing protein [Nitrospirota bacterium]
MRVRLPHPVCVVLGFLLLSAVAASAQEITVSGAKVSDPTNTGAASASIPIEVPPGRNGIAPRISIDYNSNRGNGWLGVGWELEVGEIQRSTKFGVNYGANDFIYLSGGASSELVARPEWGTNYYGAKIEGAFSKLYFNSTSGGWEVTTKDGTKYFYGTTAASRQDNQYGVFKWCLDRVQDTNGNYMTVSYVKDQGEIYLDRIDYTGNTQGLSPTNYVKFYRESRTDVAPMYTSNAEVKTGYRLKTIEVYGNGQLARKCDLNYTYSTSTNRSILASVTHYGNDGATSLPVTTFTWRVGGDGSFGSYLSTGGPGNFAGMADVNGDGRADLIKTDTGGTIYVFLSNGNGTFGSYLSTGGPGNFAGMADVNGDGRADLIKVDSGGTVYTFLSRGDGTFASYVSTGGPGNFGSMADVNGDGHADLIKYTSDGWVYVFLSQGNGTFGSSVSTGGPGTLTSMADVNGDGRADLIKTDSGGTVYTLLSRGDGTFGSYVPTGGPGSFAGVGDVNGDGFADLIKGDSGGNAYIFLSKGDGAFGNYLTTGGPGASPIIADVNGDGRADLIKRTTDGWVYVFISKGDGTFGNYISTGGPGNFATVADVYGSGRADLIKTDAGGTVYMFPASGNGAPDLLSTVNNGIGGTTTITYTPSSAYPNHLLPFVVQTVSRIEVNDDNGNIMTTNYSYSGGRFDMAEREFRGFELVQARVRATDTVDLLTETWYRQDAPFQGLPVDQIVKDSTGKIYSRAINAYQSSVPFTGSSYPRLTKKDDYLCDGAATDPAHLEACKHIVNEFDYDVYGNMTRKLFWGDLEVPGDGKDEYTVYEADLTKWQFRPVHSYVYDSYDVVKAQAWLSYDSRGNLVAKTAWLEGGSSPVTSFDYNIYGNQVAITDPMNNTSTIEYDPTYTYPVKTTNPLGHTAYVTYDYRTGKPLTKTDPNGNVGALEYDVFGRLLEAVSPHNGASAAAWKESYYDGFGRVIKTRTPGPDGKYIISETVFNNRGQVFKASLPYFADASGNALETRRWTTFTYDVLGRPVRVDNPDNTYVRKEYFQNRTTLIDANGHVKVEEKDVYGKLVKVEEYSGVYPNHTLYATTTYEYDILGNLLYVTDALGNETMVVYDSLSRKIAMNDPDMGLWSYQYDDNGNLVSQTDAKNQTITFTYDALNRITKKDYPVESTMVDVVYEYDNPNVPNSTGRLTKVTDASGTEEYFYDSLGRASKVKKTVDGVAYTTETAYDALGRPASIKYPDGEVINYTYDAAGNLTGVQGYVTYTDFNALGQAANTTYANGVTTVQQYYADNNRLYSITTNSPVAGGLQNVSYEYDSAGNIGKINDLIDPNRTQTFTYDHLNRLTMAESVSYGSTLTYTYNEIGNMMYNSRVGSYFYSPSKPHAVTQAGTNIYEYDANGNMTRRLGHTFTYDYDNRATRLIGNNGTVDSVYDYTGQRVKKIVGSNTTIYIGKMYECKNGSTDCTKYIFAGRTRIASKSTATSATRYYHGDHLGSTSVITDETGGKVAEYHYYPFGETIPGGYGIAKYKYTGQEEDPETGLYYYNARYYDPALARFISADTIVGDPRDPQDLNRYSYVNNNPLKYTDPTGHLKLGKIFKAVVSVVVGIVATVATAGTLGPVVAGALGGALAGGTSAALNGGNIGKGMLLGAIAGAVTGGIFSQAGTIAEGFSSLAAKAGVHTVAGAISGGINSAIYGGDVWQGMITGAISAGIARYAGGSLYGEGKLLPDSFGYQLAGRAVIGGVVGGITSQIYGGNFGEGFVLGGITAAAGFIFNEWYHEMAKGVAFGFGAAGIVTAEVALLTGEHAIQNLAGYKLGELGYGVDNPLLELTVDKAGKAQEIREALSGKYEKAMERIRDRSSRLYESVYGRKPAWGK